MDNNKVKLDVDVDEIYEEMSSMFGDMIGSIIEYLEYLPDNKISFDKLISDGLNNRGILLSMLPVIEGSYVEYIYIKDNIDVYAKTTNGNEYDVNEESFVWVLRLCEFIKTYC